ncbi:hypothetical protein CRENBAI_001866 [Crenichthys baileyi]|uniref:Uncharacterized protein n=1 Tax=Crenichthys baileyi TaxID=28760 RepID=A0AAV9R859_9TELE
MKTYRRLPVWCPGRPPADHFYELLVPRLLRVNRLPGSSLSSVPPDLLQLATSWLLPPFLPLRNLYTLHPPLSLVLSTQSPSTAADQGTKHYCWTHLLSSTLFPPARFPLLLAVYQQQPSVTPLSRPNLFL